MKNIFLVAFGSALGGVARYWLTGITARLAGEFPLGTLLINVVGSFAIGFVAARPQLSSETRLFLMTGIFGGFTTFSAFSAQACELWRSGQILSGTFYVVLSVTGSLLACALGWWMGSGSPRP